MQRLENGSIRGAEISGKIIKPSAISGVCPYCTSRVVFTLTGFSNPGPQNSVSAIGNCPACRKKVGFWIVNSSGSSEVTAAEIFQHPASKSFQPNIDEMSALPEPLRRSYIATVESYNAGIYVGAAVSGRRTIEGIFKYLVPEDKRNLVLAKLIDAAITEKDLSAPLKALSHAIRSGGNLGAHFDAEHEPDESVARQMIELLSYLISYLYVLPEKIQKLESDLGKHEAREPTDS